MKKVRLSPKNPWQSPLTAFDGNGDGGPLRFCGAEIELSAIPQESYHYSFSKGRYKFPRRKYNSAFMRKWYIDSGEDGSINAELVPGQWITTNSEFKPRDFYSHTAEWRTAPMRGTAWEEFCGELDTVFTGDFYRANKSCGLHVHVGLEGPGQALRVYKVARYLQKGLLEYKEFHRRTLGDTWAKLLPSVSNYSEATWWQKSVLPQYRCHTSGDNFIDLGLDDRYYWVNTEAFQRHGTVEFRLFAGTTKAEDILGAVLFSDAVVHAAVGRNWRHFANWRQPARENLWRVIENHPESVTIANWLGRKEMV